MIKYCLCCGEEVNRRHKFCSPECRDAHTVADREKKKLYDALRLIIDPVALEKMEELIEVTFQNTMLLRKKSLQAKQRLREQDNFWENLVCDLREDNSISPSHIRWWGDKLISEHHVNAQSRMINWLKNVATVIETYAEAKKYEKSP